MDDLRAYLVGRSAGPAPAAAPAPAPPAAAPPAPGSNVAQLPESATAYAERVAQLTELCAIAGQPERLGGFLQSGASVQQVRERLLEERAAASDAAHAGVDVRFSPGPHNAISLDNPASAVRARVDALCHRLDGRMPDDAHPAAAQFANLSVAEIFGISPRFGAAFGGMQTSSDFPLLAGEFAQRRARLAYDNAPNALKQVARQELLDNFLPANVLAAGQFPRLQSLSEHAAVKHGVIEEEGGQILQLYTVGVIVAVTRPLIVNDNLRLIDQKIQRAAESAALTEADALAAAVNTPGNWSDGDALFHANHGNLGTDAGAIDVASLDEAVQSIRLQKDVDGVTYLSLAPSHLIVPPTREVEGRKVLADITAATVDNVNPFSRTLELVVEPRLQVTNAPWYVAAAGADGLLYGYLRDAPGPQVKTEDGFDYDGTRVRVLLDFAVTWADFRPWFRNPGA